MTTLPHYVRKKEICRALKISRATLERQIADGEFPPPVRLGKRIVAWKMNDIEEYCNNLQRMEGAYTSQFSIKEVRHEHR